MPGTSGVLSPYNDMKGLYFDDSPEPDDFRFQFMKSVKEILKKEGVTYVELDFENKEDYYKVLNEAYRMVHDGFKVSFTSRENNYDIILEEEEDLEAEVKPKPKKNSAEKKKGRYENDKKQK